MQALLLELCRLRAFTAAELCRFLNRSDAKELRRTYLRPMREAGLLRLKYPETEKHPHQAYLAAGAEEEKVTDRPLKQGWRRVKFGDMVRLSKTRSQAPLSFALFAVIR